MVYYQKIRPNLESPDCTLSRNNTSASQSSFGTSNPHLGTGSAIRFTTETRGVRSACITDVTSPALKTVR